MLAAQKNSQLSNVCICLDFYFLFYLYLFKAKREPTVLKKEVVSEIYVLYLVYIWDLYVCDSIWIVCSTVSISNVQWLSSSQQNYRHVSQYFTYNSRIYGFCQFYLSNRSVCVVFFFQWHCHALRIIYIDFQLWLYFIYFILFTYSTVSVVDIMDHGKPIGPYHTLTHSHTHICMDYGCSCWSHRKRIRPCIAKGQCNAFNLCVYK